MREKEIEVTLEDTKNLFQFRILLMLLRVPFQINQRIDGGLFRVGKQDRLDTFLNLPVSFVSHMHERNDLSRS